MIAPLESVAAARAAGLRYTSDDTPGIHRRRAGRSWRYFDANGDAIQDEEDLRRIRALVIPPAWTDLRISPDPRGHIQATGRDERGRKQSPALATPVLSAGRRTSTPPFSLAMSVVTCSLMPVQTRVTQPLIRMNVGSLHICGRQYCCHNGVSPYAILPPHAFRIFSSGVLGR